MNKSFAILGTVFVLGSAACEKSGKETQREVDNAQAQAQTEITNAQVKADEKVTTAQRDFEKTREDYRHDMQSNLDELDKKIADLDAKILKTNGDKKLELNEKVATLRAQRTAFAEDVKQLPSTPAATWDATKAHMDKEWSEIKHTSDKIVW